MRKIIQARERQYRVMPLVLIVVWEWAWMLKWA